MSNILDKTLTVRQVGRWIRRATYIVIPLYLLFLFWNAWNLKIGGVSLNTSPFKDRIPQQCLNYAGRSIGTPGGRTLSDDFLLRGRLQRVPIESLIDGRSLAPACFGYAVLGGLHGMTAGDADFVEQWTDKSGNPVVTVHVTYNRPYSPETESKK